MTVIDVLLRFCAGRATIFMAGGLALGLIVPPLSSALGPVLPSVVWTVLFLSMLRVAWQEVAAFRHRAVFISFVTVFILIASPALMTAILDVFGNPGGQGLSAAFVLMAASSPYTAVAAVAMMLGLDAALALVILVLTTLLMPFVLPIVVVDWLGFDVALESLKLMQRLGLVVGIATVLAVVVKLAIGAERLARNAWRIDGLIVVMIVVFGIALMDGVTARLIVSPSHVLAILLGAFAVNLGLVTLGVIFFWRSGRRTALTVGYIAGNGNMAILLAVLPANADENIALYFALGQFPMFLLPMVLKPLFQRILDKNNLPPVG